MCTSSFARLQVSVQQDEHDVEVVTLRQGKRSTAESGGSINVCG